VAVNFDDCRVDHGELHVWIIRYGVKNPSENAGLYPIAIALEHRIPVAERRRQISPWAGHYTTEAIARRREISALIRVARALESSSL